jgi:hypothetical protein
LSTLNYYNSNNKFSLLSNEVGGEILTITVGSYFRAQLFHGHKNQNKYSGRLQKEMSPSLDPEGKGFLIWSITIHETQYDFFDIKTDCEL